MKRQQVQEMTKREREERRSIKGSIDTKSNRTMTRSRAAEEGIENKIKR